MKQPHDYTHRLLVAVTGLSPQIVTETLYALAVAQKPPFIPTGVRLITTQEGAERAELSLLHAESGWFHRLRADYDLPPIDFEPEHIHVLKDDAGAPMSDIRTPADNARAADAILQVVRALTRDDGTALHVSIAGGRKTMGFHLGYQLSLCGRRQDRLSHVLVNEPFEGLRDFFYPTPRSCPIYDDKSSRYYDAKDAEVTLAEIPFLPLGSKLPEDYLDKKLSYDDMLAAMQQTVPELFIDLPTKRLRAAGKVLDGLPVAQFAFLAWHARRRKEGREWLVRPDDNDKKKDPGYGEAFLKEYREIPGRLVDGPQDMRHGMTREFFTQTKSKLNGYLNNKLRAGLAEPYLISGRQSQSGRGKCFGLDIAPSAIHFESLEVDGNPGRRGKLSPPTVDGLPRLTRAPQDYPRRLLLAVAGLTPQILTETLYALAVQREPSFVPTEVRLITTEKGAQKAKRRLLRPGDAYFQRLCADYGLSDITFGDEQIQVLKDSQGQPLQDIRSPEDNTRMADEIKEIVRILTQDGETALHVSIAGGRKTMGFHLGYALSLYGRRQDRISHVLVNESFERLPEFFYPTPRSCPIYDDKSSRYYDAKDAEVTLAEIPFLPLRSELPEDYLNVEHSYDDTVTAIMQRTVPELVIDLPTKRLRAAGKVLDKLPAVQFAFLAWQARRRKEGREWLVCPVDIEEGADKGYKEAFMKEYDEIEVGRHDLPRLEKGMPHKFFTGEQE